MSLSDHTQPAPADHPATTVSPSPSASSSASESPESGASTVAAPESGVRDPAAPQGAATQGVAPAGTDLGEPVEIVPRGILFSLAAIPLGMAASVLIWKMGFIASITSFLIAGVAGWLYVRGAGAAPRKGWLPLLGVILVGVAASFFAIVAADLVEIYGTPEGQASGYPSTVDFVTANLFYGPVLKSYGSDLVMFLVFAALGVFGTVRRLMGVRKTA
jgi:hypothetical protein